MQQDKVQQARVSRFLPVEQIHRGLSHSASSQLTLAGSPELAIFTSSAFKTRASPWPLDGSSADLSALGRRIGCSFVTVSLSRGPFAVIAPLFCYSAARPVVLHDALGAKS